MTRARCDTGEVLRPADLEPDRVRPLLRVEYERLVESGAFEDERVELLRAERGAASLKTSRANCHDDESGSTKRHCRIHF
jgi:hypothetical protein